MFSGREVVCWFAENAIQDDTERRLEPPIVEAELNTTPCAF